MECKKVREDIVPYLDHELNSALSQQIRQHLDTCAACRQEVRLYTQTWDLLGAVPELELPANAGEAIKTQVRNLRRLQPPSRAALSAAGHQEQQTTPVRRIRWLRVTSIAAAACLVIALTLSIITPRPNVIELSESNTLQPKSTDNQTTASHNIDEANKTKLQYYKELLASYQSANNYDDWYTDNTKTISPYLFNDNWNLNQTTERTPINRDNSQ